MNPSTSYALFHIKAHVPALHIGRRAFSLEPQYSKVLFRLGSDRQIRLQARDFLVEHLLSGIDKSRAATWKPKLKVKVMKLQDLKKIMVTKAV